MQRLLGKGYAAFIIGGIFIVTGLDLLLRR